MKLNKTFLPSLLMFTIVLTACTDEKPKDKPTIDEEINDPDASMNTSFDGKVFSIPSPLQTALLIKESNVPFNEDLLNNVDNIDLYTTEMRQALNLGIYGTDLGYAALYKQNSTSLKYLATVEKLTNKLGLEGAFDKNFMTRFEKNSANQDSMMLIVSQAFRKSDDFLKNNDRKNTSALILTGGWIESLYFACELNQASNNPKIVERIGEQQQTLKSIIEILEEYNKDKANAELISDMQTLKIQFDKVMINYEFIEPSTNEAKKLTTLNHKMEIKVDTNVLNEIRSLITSIRKKITE